MIAVYNEPTKKALLYKEQDVNIPQYLPLFIGKQSLDWSSMNDGFIGQQKADDKSKEKGSTEYVLVLGFGVWSWEGGRVGEVLR